LENIRMDHKQKYVKTKLVKKPPLQSRRRANAGERKRKARKVLSDTLLVQYCAEIKLRRDRSKKQ
jgi:hypothetical protein